MITPLRRRIRHARRLFGYGALVVLILAAAVVGIANQLLPLVERNPQRIAAWLSERVGQDLQFSAAYAEWTRRGPRFILSDLRVGSTGKALQVGSAELLVAVYSGLLPGTPLTELKIRDLALTLEQGEDRRWRMLGLPTSTRSDAGDPLEALEGFGELQIERASLRVRAPGLAIDRDIPRVDLRMRVGGDRIRGGMRAWSRAGGTPLNLAVDLQRGHWSGSLWAGIQDGELADWADLLAATGIRPAGQSNVDVWAELRGQQVVAISTRMDVSALSLVAISPWLDEPDEQAPEDTLSPPAQFQRLRLQAAWQATPHGWQVEVPRLQLREADGTESDYEGLWLAGGDAFAMKARSLPLAPVRSLLPLSGRLPDGLRHWLYRAAPEGELHEIDVIAVPDGPVRGTLRVHDLAWQPSGNHPGASGLAGSVVFDQHGGVIRLADTPMVFNWPVGFGEALPVRVRGTLGWWRDVGTGCPSVARAGCGGADERWTFGSSGLRIAGEDYAANVRAELHLGEPGRKPRLDIAAQLDDTTFVAAKRFWVRHKMPPATVQWLDTALVEGQVTGGRASLGGDLDDWPFVNRLGRFDARASVRNARLKFNPAWPEAEQLDADVEFDGPGFSVTGSSVIAGNPVERLAGGIAVFKEPWLELDIASRSQGQALRQLMLDSPLQASHGEHLRAATIEGPANVGVRLALPLKAELGERRIEGEIDLTAATLADARWNIRFTDVSGRARFDHTGFAAEDLAVRFEGEPARFDLAAGADFVPPEVAVQAQLRGEFPPAVLIKQHAPLAWLQPWLSGRSEWLLALRVPMAAPGKPAAPAQLSVSSELQGTKITLPAPLAKDAAEPLALRLDSALPAHRGELSLRLGERLFLRGQMAEGDTVMRGVIDLGAPGNGPLPNEGLAVRGHAERLDAAGWIGFAASGEGAGSLRSVDVRADVLEVLGSDFRDTTVKLTRQGAVTTVDLAGEVLAGRIETRDGPPRAVQGRLSRVYWPPKPETDGPEPLPPVSEEQDPGAMPALDFVIDDMRLGNAQFGRTELLTTPLPKAMRIERFQSRSKRLSLDASGEWRRPEADQRSRSEFLIDFKAKALGELMSDFGLGGMIKDGPISGRLAGSWPGSPGGFQLARFSGQLSAEVGEGQLLDVEPGGGGRVLGLISLAEIPRRLSLDFSDFFSKGFGFNRIYGDFEFSAGRARTDNLAIDGPAAEIRISGLTDLREQTYEQRIEVLPKTGGVLPAIGALAGGPAGAALGAMAQAVFQKPLKQAGRTVYQVSGPWKKPEIEVIDRGPAPTATSAPEATTDKPPKDAPPADEPSP